MYEQSEDVQDNLDLLNLSLAQSQKTELDQQQRAKVHLHSYSAAILKKMINRQFGANGNKFQEGNIMPLGQLIFNPIDLNLMICNYIRTLFIKQVTLRNPITTRLIEKILIVSSSHSLSEEMMRELSFNNIIREDRQAMPISFKDSSNWPTETAPTCKSFSGRNHRQIFTHEDFKNEIKPYNIVLFNSKHCYDYTIRGILHLEDFDMIIFSDISQAIDQNQIHIMKDFWYDRPQSNTEKRPEITAFFGQMDSQQSEYHIKEKILRNANDFYSEFIGLTNDEINKLTKLYERVQPLTMNEVQKIVEVKHQVNEVAYISDHIKVEMTLGFPNTEELKQMISSLIHDSQQEITQLGQLNNYQLHLIPIDVWQNKLPQGFKGKFILNDPSLNEDPAHFQQILHQLSELDSLPDQIVLLLNQESSTVKNIIEVQSTECLRTFNVQVLPALKTALERPICPHPTIFIDKRRQPYEYYYIPESGAKITIKDAHNQLKIYVEQETQKCKHIDCKKPTTSEQIQEDKLNNKQVLLCDNDTYNLRMHKEPNLKCIQKTINGQQMFFCQLIMPHCFKKYVNCFFSDYASVKKKDAEGYPCLKAIEMLTQKGHIDKHLHWISKPDSSKKGSDEQSETDSGKQQQVIDMRKPLDVYNRYIYDTIGQVQQLNLNYPYRGSKDYLGFLMNKRLSHLNTSYELILERKQRQLNLEQYIKMNFGELRIPTTENLLEQQQNPEQFLTPEQEEQCKKEVQMFNETLTYNLDEAIELEIPSENTIEYVQKLKFYHTWSYFQVMNLGSSFIRGILKGKYTFSQVLFGKETDFAWKQYKNLLQLTGIKRRSQLPTIEQLLEVYVYTVPLVQENRKFKVNWQLINDTIRFTKMQLISLVKDYERIQPEEALVRMETQELQQKFGRLWNNPLNFKRVAEVKSVVQIEGAVPLDDWSRVYVQKQNRNKEYFQRECQRNLMTLPQFYQTIVGIFVSKLKSPSKIRFHRLSQFSDSSSSRQLTSAQQQFNKELALQSIGQTLGEYKDELTNYNWVPSQVSELLPWTYEQYTVMQLACQHLQKLNECLRIDKFIELFFSDERLDQLSNNDDSQLYLWFGQQRVSPRNPKDVRDLMFDNIQLVNEALTAPQAQTGTNYERLEIYGDALISMLVIVELYLTRKKQYSENDLDSLRKTRISNEAFIKVNLENRLYDFMLTETTTQPAQPLPKGANPNLNILRNIMPPCLGGHEFALKIRGINIQNFKMKLFLYDSQICKAQLDHSLLTNAITAEETATKLVEVNECGEMNSEEWQMYKDLLQLIMCRHPYKEEIDKKYPFIKEIWRKLQKEFCVEQSQHSLGLVDRLVTEVSKILTLPQLKLFFLNYQRTKYYDQGKDLRDKQYSSIKRMRDELRREGKVDHVMDMKVTIDKKMADVFEAMTGAVMQTGGIHATFSFLRSMGVLKVDFDTLRLRIENEGLQWIDEDTRRFMKTPYVDTQMHKVEETLGYRFKDKCLLVQAFIHRTYSEYISKTRKLSNFHDYNLLEFLGDTILNYFVLDFFYHKSQPYKDSYSPNFLHKLKSELVNNDFLSLIMIENNLHEHIMTHEKSGLRDKMVYFAQLVKQYKQTTRGLYKKVYLDREDCTELKQTFMEPQTMKMLADVTQEERINIEDLHDFSHKIFGDVFEALVAAVFLDSGGNIQLTHQIIMRVLEPYLYIYGNTETTQEHPRTQINDKWNKLAFTNLSPDNQIKISHANSSTIENGQTKIIYKGIIGNQIVLEMKFDLQENNKNRKFYKAFKQVIDDLIDNLQRAYPNLEQQCKQIVSQTNKQNQSDLFEAQKNLFRGSTLKQEQLRLENIAKPKEMQEFVLDYIKKFKESLR